MEVKDIVCTIKVKDGEDLKIPGKVQQYSSVEDALAHIEPKKALQWLNMEARLEVLATLRRANTPGKEKKTPSLFATVDKMVALGKLTAEQAERIKSEMKASGVTE